MATLLLDAPPDILPQAPVGTATLVLLLTPVRAPDGTLHVRRLEVPAGAAVAAILPPHQDWARVTVNGGVLPPEQWDVWPVQPGDELWAIPRFGIPAALVPLLTYAAVGLVVSIATTALTYLLFPPSTPHMTRPDEHTFTFTGIQTAVGPGNVVPIIYGRHRVGGQLLQASVEQALTVLETGAGTQRLQAISDPPRLSMLIALGEGPIDHVDLGTLEINGQPAANFPGVQLETRPGTLDQPPMPFFSETRNTFADGRALPDNSDNTGHEIIYTTTAPVTAYILNIVFNEGLFQINGKGEKEDNTVNVAYRLRFHPDGPWTSYSVYQVSAQRTAPVRFGIRVENLAQAVFDIAVNFGGIRHSDDLHAKFQPTLESVTEVQAGTQTYPGTALLGIRAVATDTLQGALPNITVEVWGRQVRIGSFAAVPAWTDNPAWCTMDFLTNTRYGLGVPDAEIDLFGFATWAAYCDEILAAERRHVLNYVLDRDGRAQALLMEIMGGSRTLLLKSSGLWQPRPTRTEAPVQLLSWTSCSNVRLTYTRDPDRINVMEGRFANEDQSFQQDVITWPTVDAWPAEMRKASLDLRGVTKPSRIMRALQFELNRRRYENVLLEMDCSLDAVVLQIHDLFRFSHPLPGWGQSGRVAEGSTQDTIHLDEPVTMQPGLQYQLYLKSTTDVTEIRVVVNTGTTTRTVHVGVPFSFQPWARDTVWAFGTTDPESAVRVFRVTRLQRKSDTTVHLEAVIHNASIYDEVAATPLPVITSLFNPLGPPPPLTFLRATELVRLQPSGATLHVVNLAWDIAPLGPGLAPYGGATIFRRTVLDSALGGAADAGAIDLGAIQHPDDANVNFNQIAQVRGHVLELDDYTVMQGATYLYRVVPVSGRDVPNMAGAREALIHVAGPTTQEFFPGTVRNLRLRGQAVGDLQWEGRDVHVQWDPVPDSGLFSSTFFVLDYIVQIWAPGQEYLLRATSIPALEFHYSFEQNAEDQARTGHVGARRDLMVIVWARTNTGRISLNPASITVTNPPPDMSNILPETIGIFEAAIISWNQYAEPRDFDHYELHLDVVTPPIAIYQDVAIGFHGQGSNFRKVFPQGLTQGVLYYTFVLPYDTFGPGVPSQIASFVATGLTAESVDSTPPATPTGLTLTQGRDISSDGTILPWVEAHWTRAPEADVAGYEVHVFFGTNPVPTVWNPEVNQNTIRFSVPGHVRVRVKLLAFDKFHNASPFTAEVELTTDGDTTPPAPTANAIALGSIKSIIVFWTPPGDLDYAYGEVWGAQVNDRTVATFVGTGLHNFVHDALGALDQRWYWLRMVDTSGNVSPFFPNSLTTTITATAGQIDTTYISSLSADTIIAGTIDAFVQLGVAHRITLDGVNEVIYIRDQADVNRVVLGKLGPAAPDWGLRILNAAGQIMWNLTDGAQTEGISNAAVTGTKIRAGSIEAAHLVTDRLVVTTAAQIANLIVADAHINGMVADKLISGVLRVLYFLGVGGQVHLDGANANIVIADQQPGVRVILGKLGPLATDYGLQIYNEFGQLMWNLNGGAQTAGIGNLQVITQKIGTNAVTASLLHATTGDGISTDTSTELARITWPALDPGDLLWMLGCATAEGAGQGGLTTNLNLREDSVAGAIFASAHANQAGGTADANTRIPMTVQMVYTVPPAGAGNKVFLLEATGIGALTDVSLVGLRLRR